MRLFSRRFLPILTISAALSVALSPSAGATFVAAAGTTTPASSPSDDPGSSHRSVPLDPGPSGPSARVLPGADSATATSSSAPVSTATLTLDEGVHVLGLRWDGPQPEAAELRVREPGASWSAWTQLDDPVPTTSAVAPDDRAGADSTGASGVPVEDTEDASRATTGDVVVGSAEVQVRLVGEATGATAEVWTTYRTSADVAAVRDLPVTGDDVAIGTRADWGANEALRRTNPRSLVSGTPQLGVTIHHTAGINNYTPEDVPSILRGIFSYHGQTLGWGDVGYAAFVDKYGRTWEGRAGGVEQNLQLAHAFGMNRDWAGITVLGNHELAPVSAAELRALSELTAWTLDTHGVQAGTTVRYHNAYEGWTRTLPVVHAHRDVGLTLCPGYSLYALMDQLRTTVAADQREGSAAVQRIGGATRYDVSARMAREAFLEGTRTAYLASGAHLADALGVGPVADARGAAVLLTRPDSVPEQTLAALSDLGVREVVLVGGPGAITPAVADTLRGRGLTVSRVEGPNRYATAAALATQRPSTGGTVYLAEGVGLADALGAAAAAAEQGGVVLLTRPDSLPAVTATALRALAPSRVVALGGEMAVSEAVREEVTTLLPGAVVERIGGRNRYATSSLLAVDAFDASTSAVVASGTAPADAMVGTQLAARHDAPVLLARPGCRPSDVDTAYRALGTTLSRLAGGTAVLEWSAGDTVC